MQLQFCKMAAIMLWVCCISTCTNVATPLAYITPSDTMSVNKSPASPLLSTKNILAYPILETSEELDTVV